MRPGRFRHSVATWAIEKGATPASVAAFLNHKSLAITRRFYATHAVPTKVPALR
ncbi:site-specific integrase [Archangium violaceum]|uniref:tyrosine-type recombinase/integrase n=1 Tax=Archangium violaceum TaxID=83451 RepID=UPI002B31CDDD|nr:site-specific integrase [Archangium violaceum]